MSFSLQYGKKGLWLGKFSHFSAPWLTHAVSTRFGGVSEGAFSGLNLALHNGDDAAKVLENRRLFAAAVDVDPKRFVTAEQVHGAEVAAVDASLAGRGAMVYNDALQGIDALITDCSNVPLLLFFADCVPVLIVDLARRVIGLSHAGWRGTVQKIAQKTVLAMQARYGTCPKDCLVGIGPSIGSCCYEVGEAVQKQFAAAFPASKGSLCRPAGNGNVYLDLWAANRLQLEEIGVPAAQIETAGTCTACNFSVFFSYRADQGKTGRIAAVISLK